MQYMGNLCKISSNDIHILILSTVFIGFYIKVNMSKEPERFSK